MIVITVLALIGALMFCIFGSLLVDTTVKRAATQISDNMRVIDEGWNRFFVERTVEPANIDTLVTEAILKARPMPPSNARASGFTGTFDYTIDRTTYNLAGSAAMDTVALLTNVTADVCRKVNTLYGGFAADAAIPTDAQAGRNIHCFANAGNNIVIKQVLDR